MPEVEPNTTDREPDPSHNMRTRVLSSRYEVYGEIAAGGMASVQYGRLVGPRGFSRAVAIKRLHPHFSREPEFISMFLDEARLSARLVHANIIHTLDVIETPGEVALVMEYVHGESLWTLLRQVRAEAKNIPIRVGCALLSSVLHGLHAAHEACDETGDAMHIVHRDVSPQNILIGSDGIPRLLDFGIAKALGRLRTTPSGEIKGKLGYIAREQLHAEHIDRRTDVYGAAAVLWEVLTTVPLFDGPSESAIVHRVLYDTVLRPSQVRADIPAALDEIVLRGLSRDIDARYASALEMALQLEHEVGLATQSEVAAWLQELAGPRLAERTQLLNALQDGSASQRRQAVDSFSNTRKIEPGRQSKELPTLAAAAHGPKARPGPVHVKRGATPLRTIAWLAAFAGLAFWLSRETVAYLQTQKAADSAALQEVAPLGDALAQPRAALDTAVDWQPSAAGPAVTVIAPEAPAVSPVAAPVRVGKRRTRAATSAAAPAAPDKHCALFYEVDANGIRRPKPECL